MIDDKSRCERIRKATETLARLLERRPELRPYQEEIERRLSNAGSIENRLAVLGFMMHEQLLRYDRDLSLKNTRIGAVGWNWQQFGHIGSGDRRSGRDRRVYADPYYRGSERRSRKDRRTGLITRESQEADWKFP